MKIFMREGDFRAFVRLLEEGREKYGMRILGYCLMDNHWHLVLWPVKGVDLSKFVGWVCTTHVRRWRKFRETVGEGHLYQGRFKSFPIQGNGHLLEVLKYVEANPLRAGMVQRAEEWLWSSLGKGEGTAGVRVQLTEWPVRKPGNWVARVNGRQRQQTMEQIRESVRRGRPLGDEEWVEESARREGLKSTVRRPGRPRKRESERGE